MAALRLYAGKPKRRRASWLWEVAHCVVKKTPCCGVLSEAIGKSPERSWQLCATNPTQPAHPPRLVPGSPAEKLRRAKSELAFTELNATPDEDGRRVLREGQGTVQRSARPQNGLSGKSQLAREKTSARSERDLHFGNLLGGSHLAPSVETHGLQLEVEAEPKTTQTATPSLLRLLDNGFHRLRRAAPHSERAAASGRKGVG